MIQLVVTAIAFVFFSGLMALSEAAIFSVTNAEAEALAEAGKPGANHLRRVKKRMTSAVVVIVVLTNTVNVLGPVLVGTMAVEIYGDRVIGLITAILTFATIVFSEIIPKSLGTHYAPRISCLAAPIIRLLAAPFLPIVWLFENLTSLLQAGERRIGTEEQIRSLARIGHSAGYIETDETQMVHRVFQLNDRTAADIMTPKHTVVSLPVDCTIGDAAKMVADSAHSRFPVVSEDGAVRGVVISHDLLTALSAELKESPIAEIQRPPLLVEPTMRADDLLRLFKERHFHLGVVGRASRIQGVVTLEDVLEELVGEIEDEKDG